MGLVEFIRQVVEVLVMKHSKSTYYSTVLILMFLSGEKLDQLSALRASRTSGTTTAGISSRSPPLDRYTLHPEYFCNFLVPKEEQE